MTATVPASGSRDDITVDVRPDHVAVVEFHRGPENYFDEALITGLADVVGELDGDPRCRALVLASAGRHFCAGAQLGAPRHAASEPRGLYAAAVRLFAGSTPIVAAVQGAAVGGGLGLALVADFRVAAPESRFSANFARLGFFPGFGLTVTLPRLVGGQAAQELLYTGARIGGERALALGLCDRLVPADEIRPAAVALAGEIAASGPLAVPRIRRALRGDVVEAVRAATEREAGEQAALAGTADFAEGVRAMADRRPPVFEGR
jgi:2-(1,2-epoxy-1,2-dihydrophenyl)acetyl-CoA isomerase